MTAADSSTQVLSLLGQGLTTVEVAEAMQLPLEVVTTIVEEKNKQHEAGIKREFEDMQSLATNGIKRVLQYGENESAVVRAAELVTDMNLGLKEKPNQQANNIFVIINERIAAVKEKRKQLGSGGGNVVDVQTA
jgi:SHS2 domain-containing protein